MQRTARAFCATFAIKCVGDRQRIRIELDHRIHLRPSFIERVNSRQVPFGDRASREFPSGESLFQVSKRSFLEIERLGGGNTRGREKQERFVQEVTAVHVRDYRSTRPRAHRLSHQRT